MPPSDTPWDDARHDESRCVALLCEVCSEQMAQGVSLRAKLGPSRSFLFGKQMFLRDIYDIFEALLHRQQARSLHSLRLWFR